jgi:hypothetical protein
MTEERTFLRDSEWASIEGKLCRAAAGDRAAIFVLSASRGFAVIHGAAAHPYAAARNKLGSARTGKALFHS